MYKIISEQHPLILRHLDIVTSIRLPNRNRGENLVPRTAFLKYLKEYE